MGGYAASGARVGRHPLTPSLDARCASGWTTDGASTYPLAPFAGLHDRRLVGRGLARAHRRPARAAARAIGHAVEEDAVAVSGALLRVVGRIEGGRRSARIAAARIQPGAAVRTAGPLLAARHGDSGESEEEQGRQQGSVLMDSSAGAELRGHGLPYSEVDTRMTGVRGAPREARG